MMRLLYPMVMLWGAGCLSPDIVDPNTGAPSATPAPQGPNTTARPPGPPAPRQVPAVCGGRTWTAPAESKDQSLAVVPSPGGGATVLTVARAGGPVRAFQFDAYGMPDQAPGTQLRIDAGDTRLFAARVGGELVTASVTGSTIVMDAVAPDFSSFHEIAKLEGKLVGDAPMLPYRNGRQAAIGGPDGLALATYDQAWTPIDLETLPGLVTALSTATYGDDIMVAWSTATECYVDRVGAHVLSRRNAPCPNVRLATDELNERATIVYETASGLTRTEISPGLTNELVDAVPIAIGATSPRVVSDGLQWWVSYLDLRGDVVVGYIDKTGTLISTALAGTHPMRDAFALALLPADDVTGGGIWLFASNGTGYSAQHLCLVDE